MPFDGIGSRAIIGASAMCVAAAALTGCGQPDTDTKTTVTAARNARSHSSFDPCSVLTADAVAAITTDSVKSTSREDMTCTYQFANDVARVTIDRAGGREAMATVRRAADVLSGMGASVADKGGAGADVELLLKKPEHAPPAVGDEAIWQVGSRLAARKGDIFIEVAPPMMHDPANHKGYPIVSDAERRDIAVRITIDVFEELQK